MTRLQGGIFVETSSKYAIHIPAACIHATFTIRGGFLVTEDFTTAQSIKALSAYLDAQLDRSLPDEARVIFFDWFERCLDTCLTHQDIKLALQAWVNAECYLSAWATSHRQWRVSVRRVWERHLSDHDKQHCVCGHRGGSLKYHLFSTHLACLLSASQIRRYITSGPQTIDH